LQKCFGVCRGVHEGGALARDLGRRDSIRGRCFEGRIQEISGLLMCAQERFDFAAQGGVGGTLRSDELVAPAAGGQGDRLSEHIFGVGCKRVHRTVDPELNCSSGRIDGERKAG
jgi:hypothetical protein